MMTQFFAKFIKILELNKDLTKKMETKSFFDNFFPLMACFYQ